VGDRYPLAVRPLDRRRLEVLVQDGVDDPVGPVVAVREALGDPLLAGRQAVLGALPEPLEVPGPLVEVGFEAVQRRVLGALDRSERGGHGRLDGALKVAGASRPVRGSVVVGDGVGQQRVQRDALLASVQVGDVVQ